MYDPNKREDLNLSVFNMNRGINESKILTSHANVDVDLMNENIIQINGGIMINVHVSVKNFMYVKEMCLES